MRVIQTGIKRFPGSFTLPDSLTYPQFIAYQQALSEAQAGDKSMVERWYALLRGLLPCVSAWAVTGVPDQPTPETFPSTPRASAERLVRLLLESVSQMLADEDEGPNA